MSRASKQSGRGLLLSVHLWLGLTLCIPLVLLGLTGTLLVFERPIDSVIAPSLHHARIGSSQPIAAIIAAAQLASPAGLKPTLFVPPTAPGDSATVRLASVEHGGGFGTQVFVDPVSLEILGVRDGAGGFMRQVHMLHANLLIGGRDGRSVVGWLGVVMLAMGLSGLYLWWPRPGRWRAAFRVRRNARGVRLHRELHGAVGVWGLAVFIIVSFSGVDLAFPETVAAAVGLVLPGAQARPAPPPKTVPVQGAVAIDVDRAVALARDAVPDADLRSIGLPARPDQPYRIGLFRPGDGDGAPVITVFVDPWSAKVADVRDPGAYPAGLKLIAWQHAIHSGAGLGWPWRILVGLCGFLPALFAVTGISMWLLKRRARRGTANIQTQELAAAE